MEEKRVVTILIKVTKTEKEKITEKAHIQGLGISSYIRQQCLKEKDE